MTSLKAYFVLEYDEKGRAHWHGSVGIPKAKRGVAMFMKSDLKNQLDGLAFVDWQVPRSPIAWFKYCCKEIKHPLDYDRISDHNLTIPRHEGLPFGRYHLRDDNPCSETITERSSLSRGEDGEGGSEAQRAMGGTPDGEGVPPTDNI